MHRAGDFMGKLILPRYTKIKYIICKFDFVLGFHVQSIGYVEDGVCLPNFICVQKTVYDFSIHTILSLPASLVVNKTIDIITKQKKDRES